MYRNILLGNTTVEYELIRKKVKNVNLRLRADGSLMVSAPHTVSVSFIESFMKRNEERILKVLSEYERRAPAAKYAEGETVSVLGKAYILRLMNGSKNRVEIKGGELWLYVKDPGDAELRKKTVESFYKELCAAHMQGICRRLMPAFSNYLKELPEIRYRRMKSRWGSCTPKKKSVCFNSLLAMSPIECMEFVAAHEFCHFIHPDHSAAFYSSLAAVMPDWKQRKAKLKKYASLIK